MSKHAPLAATDKRRQAGHKHPKAAKFEGGGERLYHDADETAGEHGMSHLFNDRRKRLGEGKRAS
jgi:hypothetical protein